MVIQLGAPLEYICHACTKHPGASPRCSGFLIPCERLFPVRITEEAPRRTSSPKLLSHPASPQIGVAVVASGGNFHAAPPRIERVVRPLDLGVFCHDLNLSIHF